MSHVHERRRGRADRRDPSRPALPPGPERRRGSGCRRLPEPRWRQWPSIAAAGALGVVVAVGLQALQAGAAGPAPSVVREVPAPVRAAGPRITLPEAQALRDAAGALTPAGVALDERAQATWLPRIGPLEAAVADPRTEPEVREELRAALAELARVGIAGGA